MENLEARVDELKIDSMTCLFLSESIDGDSFRQEQGGQRDGSRSRVPVVT